MRKNILIFIMCMPLISAKAETFYTDYKLFNENSESFYEEYLDNELYKIEKQEGYNNYEVINSFLGYYPINKPPLNYTYYDLDDYQIIDSYSKTPYSKEDSIYNSNRIKKIKSARTIQLRSFITNAYLRELIIKYKGTPINYSYTQTNYNSNDTLSSNHNIIIDLQAEYDLEYLQLEFTLYDNTLSRIAFMLNVYSGSYYPGSSLDYFDNELYRHKYTEKYIVNFLNEDDFNSLIKNISWIRVNSYNDTYSVPYYKSNYTTYKYYLTYKNYLNIYTKEALPNYTLDYEDKKDIYDYYIRDYITVDDNITDLNNIHIDSSIPIEDINTTYNEETKLLIITYDDYTFYKKIELPADPIIEKPIVEEPIIEPTTKKVNKKKEKIKTQTTTKKNTTKPIIEMLNNDTNQEECPLCEDNSFLIKLYKIGNSILLIILSIMCKHYVFSKKE